MIQILKKVEVVRASELKAGDTKFVVGRVVLTQNPVIAPVSNSPCVYYKVVCEEYVTKHRTVQEEGGGSHQETYQEWEHMFTETKQANFLLADPLAQAAIFVPADQFSLKVYVKQDSNGASGGARGFFDCDPSSDNPHLKALLQRHGADSNKFFGINISSPRIR